MPSQPITSSRRGRLLVRLGTEAVAAILAPLQVMVMAVLPLLPYTAALVANLERARAHRLGAARRPLHSASGSLWRGVLARSRTRAAWRHDLAIMVASMLVGMVGLATLLTLGLGGLVMVCAPVLARLGLTPVLGSWTGQDPLSLAAMTVLGGVATLVEVAILLGLSQLRDLALERLDDRDEDRRAAVQLAAVRTNRSAVLDAFEAERRRIERDLHDGPQQDLVALSITLGMLERELVTGGDAQRGRQLSRRAHELADQSLSSLRETVHRIHPRELTDLGLFASVAELTGRSPLDIDLTCRGTDADLSPATASAAYYVIAEALTNVMKHAATSTATVTIAEGGDRLVVTVTDEGRGGAVGHAGRGLAGLRERLAALDGHLELSSPAGRGTCLRATIPVPAGRQVP